MSEHSLVPRVLHTERPLGGHGATYDTPAVTLDELRDRFATPAGTYSTAPLWVWNDDIDEAGIRASLQQLADQGIRQVIVHPRPGLITPFLSEAWFKLWDFTLTLASRLNIKTWIYDENSYPSGFAGGLVPNAMPRARGLGLTFQVHTTPPVWQSDLVGVYRQQDGDYVECTAPCRDGKPLPPGDYLSVERSRAPTQPWYGDRWYVNLLTPGVTEKFIEIALEPYRCRSGASFGNRIPGVFTDEPHIAPAAGLPWTDDLPQQFEQRWGYALLPVLPALYAPVGDYQRVRHNYYQTLLDLFIERWARPYYDYCAAHDLILTGHYWEHDWPIARRVPDSMALMAWQQQPGIDILTNRYNEGVQAQFGNARAVKEVQSVAAQLGRPRTLCEAFGAAGWELTFEGMKRIGDWLLALGVTLIDEHLSFLSIRGARKRDHPPTFSAHQPWWHAYKNLESYFARCSSALSAGAPLAPVLILEPTTTAWMLNAVDEHDPILHAYGADFQNFVLQLCLNQIDFHLGSERILADHAAVRDKQFVVGRCHYDRVVLPTATTNLNQPTLDLLVRFLAAGGMVYRCGPLPERIDGTARADLAELLAFDNLHAVTAPELIDELQTARAATFSLTLANTAPHPRLFHQRRRLANAQLLFLANTSATVRATGQLTVAGAQATELDPHTGQVHRLAVDAVDGTLTLDLDIPSGGSRLLVFTNEPQGAPAGPATPPATAREVVAPVGKLEVERTHPNVLTLDYVDVRCGPHTLRRRQVVQASTWVFQQHGLLANPWDRAVQVGDERSRQTFSADSGFSAEYRFVIEEALPPQLIAVLERPELYRVTCNDQAVEPTGDAWLDPHFGQLDITSSLRLGENRLRIDAAPLSVLHELEAAYLLGEFELRPAASGFSIVPARPLTLGSWKDQGLPLYGHGVAYTQTFDIAGHALEDACYRIELGTLSGSVAEVHVNGSCAGHIWHQPYELDITQQLEPGRNTIRVVVIGTLKNTLGPHHGEPVLGLAGPLSFEQAPHPGPPPGMQYDCTSYGLHREFELIRVN